MKMDVGCARRMQTVRKCKFVAQSLWISSAIWADFHALEVDIGTEFYPLGSRSMSLSYGIRRKTYGPSSQQKQSIDVITRRPFSYQMRGRRNAAPADAIDAANGSDRNAAVYWGLASTLMFSSLL